MAEQKFVETCPCGSRFELAMSGWLIRTFDFAEPLANWRGLHRRHIDQAHAQRSGPTKAQRDHFDEVNRELLRAGWGSTDKTSCPPSPDPEVA